jgi:D-threonate/D-erythronate kinase
VGIRRALVAPAIPAQGRITENGRLVGAGIATPIDIAARFSGSGCDLSIPDTRNDDDMDAALAWFGEGPSRLLVGAAGLAAALARHLAPGGSGPVLEAFAAPMLLAIGSRDPITLAQVDALRARRSVAEVKAPGGCIAGPRPTDGVVLLQLVQGGTEGHASEVGARFARTAADLLHEAGTRTLFACGGETADGILGELAAGVLMVEGELLPGVPVSRMSASGRALRLVTKSGGFGGADTLIAVVDAAEDEGRRAPPL